MRFLTLVAALLTTSLFAQLPTTSVLREESQHYSTYSITNDNGWDSLRVAEGQPAVAQLASTESRNVCTLTKRVFGWHPYWVGSVYTNYQWNLLSDLCYFDYSVSPTTGNNTNASFQWSTSAAVTAAIANNVNVHICATLFSSHATFLASSTAKQTFITNIISLLQARGGKGVNIDFEGMQSSDRPAFTAFIQSLSTQLHTAIPGSEVSIALYAVDWGNVFDIPNLTPSVDLFTLMGYDYYWSGSTTAGPTDPLYNFQPSYNYTLTKSTTFYLKQGMPTSKLLLGLPYYGREWETVSSIAPSATTGNYTATKTYSVFRTNANNYYNQQQWDAGSFASYYSYQVSNTYRQLFINNAYSLGTRFDMVNQRNLGGIGIWALGYDDGFTEYWNEIETHFSTCATVACSDTLFDMGGPASNYYDREDYYTTISPNGAAQVSLSFLSFDVELNYDTLWLYDGASTASPIIGAYTGTNSPGTVTSTGPSITFRFKSDNATTNPGWMAIWQCIVDNTRPTTSVSTTNPWQTTNFNANFTDVDNVGGTGIEKSFYQVADYDATEWRANASRGFFNDDFTQASIHPDWTSAVGTWAVNGTGKLEQSDETSSNTNIYASLTQNLSNRYLYHWQGKITGTGNNRRAGFHFFSDNGALTNRGNSYFVWFRLDQSVIEIYKVVNDVFTLQSSSPYTFTNNAWYDFKVSYDRISGVIEVYVNDVYSASWDDTNPYVNGSFISFRSGNCNWQVDDLHVYRSRFSNTQTAITTASACSTCDLRYENINPSSPAGKIRSITKDSVHLLSIIQETVVNVDWTAPLAPSFVDDGLAADIDTTLSTSQLQANWGIATDPNSGVVNYEYAMGSFPGGTDVVNWTSATPTFVTHTGLSLTPNQWYYVSVRGVNAAGLVSTPTVSDGQVVDISLGENELALTTMRVAPNPFASELTIQFSSPMSGALRMLDAQGRVVAEQRVQGETQINWNTGELSAGIYLLELKTETTTHYLRLIRQ